MKSKKFIPFGAPKISEKEAKEIIKTLKSGWIGTGPKVIEFEKAFKEFTGSKYALAFSSCTAALHLSLMAAGVKEGDEVITTPLTYAATGNVILQIGAKPVFADVDLETYNIDPEKIEGKITKRTKAIIPVHFGGWPCDLNKINRIAGKHRLAVIEDAAHAIGAKYSGKMIGNSQNYVCFSLYANKNITAGEGGVLCTNNGSQLERIKIWRSSGVSSGAWGRFKEKIYLPALLIEPGYKYNFTDFQAALGLGQLKKAEKWQKIREKYAKIFDSFFENIPGVFRRQRSKEKGSRGSIHLYTLRIDPKKFKISRDQILEKLNKKGIGAVVHYIPLPFHPYYKKTYGYKKGDFPRAEMISENIFTIPLTPHLKEKEIRKIGETVSRLLSDSRK